MKLLLTSAGIKNPTIHGALVGLLGKPIAESNALCIPTGAYGSPYSTPAGPWRFLSGRSDQPMTELGWRSLGVLELTALPSMGSDRWVEWVRETDALLVNGGEPGSRQSPGSRPSLPGAWSSWAQMSKLWEGRAS